MNQGGIACQCACHCDTTGEVATPPAGTRERIIDKGNEWPGPCGDIRLNAAYEVLTIMLERYRSAPASVELEDVVETVKAELTPSEDRS